MGWNSARSTSSNVFTNFDPLLSSNVAFSFSQPLLRAHDQPLPPATADFAQGPGGCRRVAPRDHRHHHAQREARRRRDLAYARENLLAQQKSLDLAKRALADNEKRVQIGTMAPIDIVEAQLEVARNEESAIVAEAAIKQAEDRLRALILNPSSPTSGPPRRTERTDAVRGHQRRRRWRHQEGDSTAAPT